MASAAGAKRTLAVEGRRSAAVGLSPAITAHVRPLSENCQPPAPLAAVTATPRRAFASASAAPVSRADTLTGRVVTSSTPAGNVTASPLSVGAVFAALT